MHCRKNPPNNDLVETVKKFNKYVYDAISNANVTVIMELLQEQLYNMSVICG